MMRVGSVCSAPGDIQTVAASQPKSSKILGELEAVLSELTRLVISRKEPLSLAEIWPIQERLMGLECTLLASSPVIPESDQNLIYTKTLNSFPLMFPGAQEADYGRFYKAFYACYSFLLTIDGPRTNREIGDDRGKGFFTQRILKS